MTLAMTATDSSVRTSPEFPENSSSCPVCSATGCVDVFEARGIPIHVGICGATAEEARGLPVGDVILSYCLDCGFLSNRLFDPEKLYYHPGYEVALHHSPTFRRFMELVTTRLMTRYDLWEKRILEIGCGNAWFLRTLAELGGNQCTGYDPTLPTEGFEQAGDGSVQLVRDYFGPQHSADADFICCLSVFENIPQPVRFLESLRSGIGEPAPGIYFEVFNAFQAIAEKETWSINYEQVNWFSRQSLANAFRQAGFGVTAAGECFEGGQYVFVDAIPATTEAPELPAASGDVPQEIRQFADHHRVQMLIWKQRLAEYRDADRRVVVWGAGGKGISFLNSLPTEDTISYVVDINPDKHGTFIPGTAQEIVSPEFLAEYRPHTIVLMNALYENEIKEQVSALGVSCELLIAR